MAHPRNLPKQDLKTQYYSRSRSSITTPSSPATSSQSSTLPQSQPSSSPSASSSSPLNITSFQQSLLSSHSDATVYTLLERSKTILSDWEIKKRTPTPKVRTDVYPEIKKVARSTQSPTLKLPTGAGYCRDWEGKVKPVATVEMAIPEEVAEVEVVEVVEKSVIESLATSVDDDAVAEEKEKDEVGSKMEVLNIIPSSSPAPPVPVAIQPIQEESPPSPSAPPPASNPYVPAVPSPPARPPVKEPKPADHTTVKVSAPAAAPKEWKFKPKIHDWFCASHRSSTSTLDPYKCTRCTKRRAASKSSLKK